MSKRLTLIMTLSVLAGFSILLLMNVASMMGYVSPRYISPNQVKGIAVEHNKVLFTLNFKQQNELLDIVNRSMPISKKFANDNKTTEKNPADVQKIIIYRIKGEDIELIPTGYVNRPALNPNPSAGKDQAYMVYYTKAWNENGLMEEEDAGELNQLLLTTYEKK